MIARTQVPIPLPCCKATLVVTTVLSLLGMGSTSWADPIPSSFNYSTEGFINDPLSTTPDAAIGTPPTGAIRFEGLSTATWTGGSPIEMGRFVVTAPTSGSVTYNNTPFILGLLAPELFKETVAPMPPGTPYGGSYITQYLDRFSISGRLNGTVDSDGHSTVIATFDPEPGIYNTALLLDGRSYKSGFPFPLFAEGGSHEYALLRPPGALAIGSANETPAAVAVPVTPVPEPSSALVFVVAAAGLALHRRRSAARSCPGRASA